jgi:hypothetical protein
MDKISRKQFIGVSAAALAAMAAPVNLLGKANHLFNPAAKLFGSRYLTFNCIVRVNQIEVARNKNVGHDERALHTPAKMKQFRGAIEKGFPGAKITWAFSWLALHDESSDYKEIRNLAVEYIHKYGDELTFIPGAYFANAYNTREQVNLDLTEALAKITDIVGGGYRPESIVAGFLAAENQRHLAEKENIHVCQGNIWSQYAVDNQDGDGSVSYPFYPSKEHFCKPAQNKTDFIDCVNLDGWTMDFLAARREGFADGFNSRMGVGPIETFMHYGVETGLKEVLHCASVHYDEGFKLNKFGWVTNNWELSLPMDGLYEYFRAIKKRWPDVKSVTQGKFGLLWREHYKINDFNYRFVERGSGIGGSDADMEIKWFMNKNFRLALLHNWKEKTEVQVIDFTRYDLKAEEPKELIRNWTLFGTINQKQTRPQDKPVKLSQLKENDKDFILKSIPELKSRM